MKKNQIVNSSDIRFASEVVHKSICTLRRYFKSDELLTKEGRILLLQLADASHNIPLMVLPENKTWSLEELHQDIENCLQLIEKINSTKMYK